MENLFSFVKSEITPDFVKDAIEKKLIQIFPDDEELIPIVLSDLDVVIKWIDYGKQGNRRTIGPTSNGRHTYRFAGEIIHGQANLVKEILARYIAANKCSYQKLVSDLDSAGIISSAIILEEDLMQRRERYQVKRETYPERNRLKTDDGKMIRVWTEFNNKEGHDTLENIIAFAKSCGWDVEIIK